MPDDDMVMGPCEIRSCQRPTQYKAQGQFWCYQDAPQSIRDYWWALSIPYVVKGAWAPYDEWESIIESAIELGPYGIVPEVNNAS
ncbi:hypothetical protein LCGC14_0841410 [marine sediment metagenome]|uniref:Uncharacterized protein n=1 Tax=marine sediment metagenome TaxID=412755 RepID=A0A0F9PHN8_9ZZZZ